jgi:G:T-mismatch repair DNA endonuclease (very short patch repair protein)
MVFHIGHPNYFKGLNINRQEVKEFYLEGYTIKEISKIFGCSEYPIRARLILAGVTRRTGGFPKGHEPWNENTHGLMNTWNKGVKNCFSKETLENMSNIRLGKPNLKNRGRMCSEENKNKISNTIRKKLENQEYKAYRSQRSKETLKSMREDGRLIIPKQNTAIELKIQSFLSNLHLEYLAHKYISEINHSYNCDILIPVQNGVIQKTIIECDGCYWHGCSICKKGDNEWVNNTKEKDVIKTKELQEQGFRVIRLWEHEIEPMQLNEFEGVLYAK